MLSLLIAHGLALAAVESADTARRPTGTDPNEIVCRREQEVGSRVATHRVCRTRAEWAEHRRQTRLSVERAQNQSQTSCTPTSSMQC